MQTNLQDPTRAPRRKAFTLVELLVSMAVLTLLMVMVFSMVDQTQKTWSLARSRVSQFREARTAFEAVTRSLTQATLNPYWDYDYGNGKYRSNPTNPAVPQKYQRQSELHFVSGPADDLLPMVTNTSGHAIFFQTAGGFGREETSSQLNDLLNARGYYVQYGDDSAFKPSFLASETPPKFRFRLMEFRPPTENLLVYLRNLKAKGNDGVNATKTSLRTWFDRQITQESGNFQITRPIADNIIAAYFLPKLPENDNRQVNVSTTGTPRYVPVGVLAPDYVYDSREWQYTSSNSRPRVIFSKNQLPPLIEVTMVAVDEKSMIRYQSFNSQGNEREMPRLIPDGLFDSYSNYQSYLDDLETLKTALEDARIDYRVFNQTVALRGAGWSGGS